ncbi:YbhB/YbcL family Raf kinase inhibitor-like protein [Marinibactrum halimedae]|uniref:Phosphatidylethanolamine-binding protein YbcL n=1 Tax=Marinibactrum halimedae TaxID=1444977 RepID=A0AA37TC26_9GAMM|nr:YbhB/YbcL family Raf kinase inhibitor-like protein [Marinibactrum halimedae]MCD9460148.1 YbhB/YbcL family Raf kinase inhibitor-like protein [Marinibactrum halimedae]GLS26382.1 phosphatidylethanolamine-binding protein YbcL [Marinibactrum halimedae]
MRSLLIPFVLPFTAVLSTFASADSFTLSSKDISNGKFMSNTQEFQGFGCSGGNQSPQLSWQGAPKGTEAFAIFAYDPDAPTGSGWWHWQLVNIPKDVSTLAAGAGNPTKNATPEGSISISNDYGSSGFGGACPPKGHGTHRYQFTVHALSQKLELPEGASAALTGYMVNAHSLGSSTIEALYKRD